MDAVRSRLTLAGAGWGYGEAGAEGAGEARGDWAAGTMSSSAEASSRRRPTPRRPPTGDGLALRRLACPSGLALAETRRERSARVWDSRRDSRRRRLVDWSVGVEGEEGETGGDGGGEGGATEVVMVGLVIVA